MSSTSTAQDRLPRLLERVQRPAPTRHAYAIAVAVAVAIHVWMFGLGHVLGTSSYWDMPQEDSRAYLMGYRYFLHEPWHWPPFVVHQMNVPFTKSIAFTDSIPLWAAVNKAIATVIPPWAEFSERAYLGLWHLLVYVLQACLGVANLRVLGKKSYAAAAMTAVLFLSIPAFIFRYGHASLSAQFLTLGSLYLYLRSRSETAPRTKLLLIFVGVLAAAALINPYQVAMSFALFVTTLVQTQRPRRIALWLPAGIVTVGASAALAGFFSAEATVPMGGFDVSSANLLSPFIPVRSVIFGDARHVADVFAAIYQYEGYAYLGLGLLVLSLLFLPRVKTLRGTIERHPVLFAVALGLWVFSLSNHVYWGSHRILAFEFPEKLKWITHQYRAPGRFVWLPMYVFIVFIWRWALDRFDRGWFRAVLPVVVIAQFVDGGIGEWRRIREYNQATFVHFLDLNPWRTLLGSHDAVEVHPPYECALDGTPSVDRVSQEIEYLTSERALPINGVYSARPTRDCAADARRLDGMQPKDHTLYVLLPQAVDSAPRLEAYGATCAGFPYGAVCSKDTSALEKGRRDGILVDAPLGPPLALNEKIFLGKGGNPVFVQRGWSWAEEDGRWTTGALAGLDFHFTSARPSRATLHVEASAPLCGERQTVDIDVLLDGALLSTMHFDQAANDAKVARAIPIEDPRPLSRNTVLVEFRPHDLRSPKVLGCNGDDRNLGVWIRNVWIGGE